MSTSFFFEVKALTSKGYDGCKNLLSSRASIKTRAVTKGFGVFESRSVKSEDPFIVVVEIKFRGMAEFIFSNRYDMWMVETNKALQIFFKDEKVREGKDVIVSFRRK